MTIYFVFASGLKTYCPIVIGMEEDAKGTLVQASNPRPGAPARCMFP